MIRRRIRRMFFLAAAVWLMTAVMGAAAEGTRPVQLPGSRYAIDVPENMVYEAPGEGNGDLAFVWVLPGADAKTARMEIDFFSYASVQNDLGQTAEKMAEAGIPIELRSVNGTEMLCTESADETDGAPCISYALTDGERMIEIVFWYSDQETADLSRTIIETLRIL